MLIRAGVLMSFCLVLPAFGQEAGEEAPWFDQLREMGYGLYLNSNVNVINGLNLTRDQAVRLRAVAEKAISKGLRRPVPRGRLCPEVIQVTETFAEVRRELMAGREPGAELQAKLVRARTVESDLLRQGLRWEPERDSCARCHAKPDEKGPFNPWDFGKLPPGVQKAMAEDHLSMGFADEKSAFLTLYVLGGDVDEILTGNQKAVVSSFSCCLLPPRGMSDPVRVGQAAVAGWQGEMLDKVRTVPEGLWPAVKERTLEKIIDGERVKNPGLTPVQAGGIRKRVGDILDRSRALDDFEYRLQRGDLCADMQLGPATAADAGESIQRFQRAFFLLLPGATEALDALMERMDAEKTPTGGDACD